MTAIVIRESLLPEIVRGSVAVLCLAAFTLHVVITMRMVVVFLP